MKLLSVVSLLLFCCFSFIVFAQTPVTFLYDAAGNRILRQAVENESALDTLSSDTLLLTLPPPVESPVVVPEYTPPVRVFPNPTDGPLTIHAPGTDFVPGSPVYIFNAQGSLMRRESLQGTQTSMDITTFPNGLYIFRLITDKKVETIKVIKQ